jgi:hypothetical protein
VRRQHVVLGGAGKRGLSGEDLVGQHAHRVDVGAVIDLRVAGDLLGSHVRRRSEHRAADRRLAQRSGHSEIGHERVARREQHVVGLDVAVHDAVRVRVGERVAHVAQYRDRGVERQRPAALEALPQRSARLERHDVEEAPIRLTRIEQRDDVRMMQLGDDLDFAQESLRPEQGRDRRIQNLDGDVATVLHVAREMHRCHAPAAHHPRGPVARGERRRKIDRVVGEQLREPLRRRACQQRGFALAVGPQALERGAPRGIAAAQTRDQVGAPLGRRLEQRVDERRDVGQAGQSVLERVAQQHARLDPVPLHRPDRQSERVGRLLFRQSAEEAALDDLRQPRRQRRQPLQRLVERQEHVGLVVAGHGVGVERDARAVTAAAFERPALARPIDEHVAHRERGARQQVPAVLPARTGAIGQLEVRLMDQRRGGERAAAIGARQAPVGDRPQLAVGEREQGILPDVVF